jgi:hypothetical protein
VVTASKGFKDTEIPNAIVTKLKAAIAGVGGP